MSPHHIRVVGASLSSGPQPQGLLDALGFLIFSLNWVVSGAARSAVPSGAKAPDRLHGVCGAQQQGQLCGQGAFAPTGSRKGEGEHGQSAEEDGSPGPLWNLATGKASSFVLKQQDIHSPSDVPISQ